MNERIALEEEMRLKKERRLVEEQMRHVQEEHKMSIKAEQKCLQEVPAQDETYEEKEEISVDVIKDKDDLNPLMQCFSNCGVRPLGGLGNPARGHEHIENKKV
ncbi:hypothetical protein TNCV_5121281 [Trichonephila clavipes]|nr:hypothetical protein TNCV_5121281 [Trichonephila clavipes]